MSKTLKELIASGHVCVSYQDTNDSVKITRKHYDDQTGEELLPQTEDMTREQINDYISMRQQQLDNLTELLKVFPVQVIKKG